MYIWGKVEPRVGSGRVRLFVGNRGSGRVGSTFRRVGSGRVQEKWPVDNSETTYLLLIHHYIVSLECKQQHRQSRTLLFSPILTHSISSSKASNFVNLSSDNAVETARSIVDFPVIRPCRCFRYYVRPSRQCLTLHGQLDLVQRKRGGDGVAKELFCPILVQPLLLPSLPLRSSSLPPPAAPAAPTATASLLIPLMPLLPSARAAGAAVKPAIFVNVIRHEVHVPGNSGSVWDATVLGKIRSHL